MKDKTGKKKNPVKYRRYTRKLGNFLRRATAIELILYPLPRKKGLKFQVRKQENLNLLFKGLSITKHLVQTV